MEIWSVRYLGTEPDATATSTVRSIYRDLTTPPPDPAAAAASGSVPKYLTDQISNYQAALSRLTGGQ